MDTATIVKAARLYYQYNYNQQQIAKEIGISRPGVSRILQQAREAGIVEIKINDPVQSGTELENKLKDHYHLDKVIIVPGDNLEATAITKNLGKAAAIYLDEIIENNQVLGVSWGSTMQEFKNHIAPRSVNNMTVVQLTGGVSRAEYDTHASEVTQKIGEAYNAVPYLLPLPAIVDSAVLKNTIISDRNITNTMNLARTAELAFFTIGSFGYDSVLVKSDYFTKKEVEKLLTQGAVGDICSRIINQSGEICSEELNDRTIGIGLEELKSKKYAVAVAGGQKKCSAIKAALKGKLINVLITDSQIAKKLLNDEGQSL